MPRYDYLCPECGWKGEKMCEASQRVIICPRCEKPLTPRIHTCSLAALRDTEGKPKA